MAAAQGEARADAGEIHRRTDECLAHAGAVGAVVAGIALLVGIAHGGVGLAAVDEAGGEDIAGRHLLAVDLVLFVDHVELVAFSQIEGEVDVVAEDVRQRRDQVIGQAGVTTGNEQRAGDAAMGIGGMQVDLGFLAFEGVALVGLVQADGLEFALLDSQRLQLSFGVELELDLLADLQMSEALGILAAGQHVVHGRGGKACLGEYGRQRIATGDGDGLPLGIDGLGVGIGYRCARFVRVLLGGVVVGGAFYLSERRAFVAGIGDRLRQEVVFLLKEAIGVAFKLQIERGPLGLDFARGEHQ